MPFIFHHKVRRRVLASLTVGSRVPQRLFFDRFYKISICITDLFPSFVGVKKDSYAVFFDRITMINMINVCVSNLFPSFGRVRGGLTVSPPSTL
jgi:hypothetical protein